MDEEEKDALFSTFDAVIQDVIADKRKNPKNRKLLDNFNARINLGLHVEPDLVFWVHLVAENGEYKLGKGKLDEHDLELVAAPEDLMYFTNGTYSTLKMLFTRNKYGNRRLKVSGGTTGLNLGKLLKLPKILVLDKVPAGG